MKRFLTFLKVEGKLSLRCPDGIIFGIGMPVGVLLLIAVVAGSQSAGGADYSFLQSAFASLLTVGICATAFMGLPLTIADYRDKKILKHFFATPIRPLMILSVQVVIGMLTAFFSAALVSLLAVFGFGYRMEGNPFLFISAFLLVMLSMYSIGMILASLCKTVKIANVVTTFVYFPMLFLSGATIPFELFPDAVQKVCNVLPLTHGIKLLKAVSLNTWSEEIWISVALLIVFAVVGCIISVVSFKWD
ncbi:ABC transporter permease [[Clostridium] innocuum]|nr:ABC transporter permease [Erysipelotrichaceae bacterium]MCR0382494.1 ABC transporter permease [[Clostridium] innocuum]MCR0411884.1 ABC transporter permease [[Clostridium] innocuum]MCR0534881.1 ABC transporter permease [[Clostridium] innocuum]MCR0540515.1 ABC transporter permease [[Clostridium] innocuum]